MMRDTGESDRPVVRLLHTSDLHITDEGLGIEVLQAVVELTLTVSPDLLLLAGDLFDSQRVLDRTISAALEQLGRLTLPVVLISGNHDCLDESSIYHRINWSSMGDHAFFAADPAGQWFRFTNPEVAVWARGIRTHDLRHRPLETYVALRGAGWLVGVTHGHYLRAGERSYRSSQIRYEEILDLECDYLALGHWHEFRDVSAGATKAYYSGSPFQAQPDESTVNLVTLHPVEGVSVERLKVPYRARTQGRNG